MTKFEAQYIFEDVKANYFNDPFFDIYYQRYVFPKAPLSCVTLIISDEDTKEYPAPPTRKQRKGKRISYVPAFFNPMTETVHILPWWIKRQRNPKVVKQIIIHELCHHFSCNHELGYLLAWVKAIKDVDIIKRYAIRGEKWNVRVHLKDNSKLWDEQTNPVIDSSLRPKAVMKFFKTNIVNSEEYFKYVSQNQKDYSQTQIQYHTEMNNIRPIIMDIIKRQSCEPQLKVSNI